MTTRRVVTLALGAAALLMGLPSAAIAAETPDWLRRAADQSTAWTQVTPRGDMSVKIAMVALTLATLLAVVVLARRKRGGRRVEPQVTLRVLSRVRVGTKAEAVLAEVGDRVILLGVTESAVSKLAWLQPSQVYAAEVEAAPAKPQEEPRADARATVPTRGRFGTVLRDALGYADESPAVRLATEGEEPHARAATYTRSARREPSRSRDDRHYRDDRSSHESPASSRISSADLVNAGEVGEQAAELVRQLRRARL